jgi:trans-AT polyketide synthase/acyltransferase/oxidoreductase domain-containing protein
MPKPIIFMFSGQGSHYYQMGRVFYEQHPTFRDYIAQADELACPTLGQPLSAIIYADDKKKTDLFNRTLYTHPALFIVQYALAQTLIAEGIYPNKVLGTSLGELVGAAVAGIIDWQTGLHIAIRQAQLIEHYCQSGEMLAVLHDKQLYYNYPLLLQQLSMAADNFQGHFLVSGEQQAIRQAQLKLKEQGIGTHLLQVSHGFHSPYIDFAKEQILAYQATLNYTQGFIPFISCTTATELTTLHAEHLWQAIRAPILFRQTITHLEQEGTYHYLDVGPSGTLATFVKYNLSANSQSAVFNSLSPYATEQDILVRLKHNLVEHL